MALRGAAGGSEAEGGWEEGTKGKTNRGVSLVGSSHGDRIVILHKVAHHSKPATAETGPAEAASAVESSWEHLDSVTPNDHTHPPCMLPDRLSRRAFHHHP